MKKVFHTGVSFFCLVACGAKPEQSSTPSPTPSATSEVLAAKVRPTWQSLQSPSDAASCFVTNANNNKLAVGYCTKSNGASVAVAWTDFTQVATELPLNGIPSHLSVNSTAFGLNDESQIVGEADDGNGSEVGLLWNPTGGSWTVQSLIAANGDTFQPDSINDDGEIDGTEYNSQNGGTVSGFVWQAGQVAQFGADSVSPHGINDSGFVLNGREDAQAGIWIDGSLVSLPTPTGDINATAMNLNNADQVVGFGSSNEALLWQRTSHGRWPVTVLPGISSRSDLGYQAFAINDAGMVAGVGYELTKSQSSNTNLVVWKNNRAIDLGQVPAALTSAQGQTNLWLTNIDENDNIYGYVWWTTAPTPNGQNQQPVVISLSH